jgi:hypothetical protein
MHGRGKTKGFQMIAHYQASLFSSHFPDNPQDTRVPFLHHRTCSERVLHGIAPHMKPTTLLEEAALPSFHFPPLFGNPSSLANQTNNRVVFYRWYLGTLAATTFRAPHPRKKA